MLGKNDKKGIALTGEHLVFSAGNSWDIPPVSGEYEYWKQRTSQLDRVNKLYRQMAGILHLSGMIEGFSRWLECYIPHLLFGYSRGRGTQKYTACHVHGEERRRMMALVRHLGEEEKQVDGICLRQEGYDEYHWGVETVDDGSGFLFLFCRHPLCEKQLDLINDALEVLIENLHRGLEYEKVHFQATRDALTGLANRRVFEKRSRQLIAGARYYGHPMSLLLLDLDNFKAVNDTFGHQRGDEVLTQVAGILREAVRETDLLARIGGDEFVVLLDNTDLEGAEILAGRLCELVNKLEIIVEGVGRLGVSVGLSQYNRRENISDWMARTDVLLYRAKTKGKAQVATS